jgi:hypothetical protein
LGDKNTFSQAGSVFAKTEGFKEHLDKAISAKGAQVARLKRSMFAKWPCFGDGTKQREEYVVRLRTWRENAVRVDLEAREAVQRMSRALRTVAPDAPPPTHSLYVANTAQTLRRELAVLLDTSEARSRFLQRRGRDKPVAAPAEFVSHCEKCFSHFRGEHRGFDHRSSNIANAADAVAKALAMTTSYWFTKEGWFSGPDLKAERCREVMRGILEHDLVLTGNTRVANPSGANCVTELVNALDPYFL